jgi:hypothetical protein
MKTTELDNIFWAKAQAARDTIFESLPRFKEQPHDAVLDRLECQRRKQVTGFYLGWCCLMALQPRGLGTDFCQVDINLAGQRIAEGTHRLASDEEIKQYKDQQ